MQDLPVVVTTGHLYKVRIANDTTSTTGSVLNQSRVAAFIVRVRNARWKSSANWRQNSLLNSPQVVFEAILTREKWAVPVLVMVSPSRTGNWKKIPTRRRRTVQPKRRSRSTPSTTVPVYLLTLLVPADQTKRTALSLVAKRLADKTICRCSRAALNMEELYQIITDNRR